MPGKKKKYPKTWPANEALTKSGMPEKVKILFEKKGPKLSRSLGKLYFELDPFHFYYAITKFLPVNANELRLVIEAGLERSMGDNSTISEEDEDKIWQICAPVLERCRKLAKEGKIIEAVEPLLVILTIIESEMDHVEDEGFIFQQLIEECFDTLKEIATYDYDGGIPQQLGNLCMAYNKQRDEEMNLYDDEWAEVSDILCRL